MSFPAEEPIKLTPEAEERIKFLQSAISTLQRKADASKDDDIREGFNLEIVKLGLKVARLRKGQPEDLPSEHEVAAEADLEPLAKPTPEQEREADLLLKRAMLEKRRGNKDEATKLVKEAAEVAPGAALVLEALGDDLMERSQYGAALEAYRNARRADPKNPEIDRKFANLSMHATTNMSVDDQLRLGLSDSALILPEDAVASPKTAQILSIFIPGSGHFVMGYARKGAALFFIWLIALALFFLIPYLMRSPGGGLPGWAYFPLAVAIGAWLAAVADMSSIAKKSEERKKPSRPTPPVNKPFE